MNQQEFNKILDDHSLWYNSNETEGKEANLSQVNLEKVKVLRSFLEETNIEKCKGKSVIKVTRKNYSIYFVEGNVHIGDFCGTPSWCLNNMNILKSHNRYSKEDLEFYLNEIKKLVDY